MLPGLALQVDLDWKNSANYYLPTIKRHNGKLYTWQAPSGPQLGGAKTPGTTAGENYWKVLDEYISPIASAWTNDLTDWNLLVNMGWYMVKSVKDVTLNPPINETAWWFTFVFVANNDVLQEVRRFSVEAIGANKLSRQRSYTGTWGPWVYDYAQYYS